MTTDAGVEAFIKHWRNIMTIYMQALSYRHGVSTVRFITPLALLTTLVSAGCYTLAPSNGGGQAAFTPPRSVEAEDIALPSGFQIEAIATGLTFPSAVVLDAEDQVYVVEAGYSYGPEYTRPRLLRVGSDGSHVEVATGTNAPWTGASFYDGDFYVSQGGHPGRIARIAADGSVVVIVDNLPSHGDHHTNSPVIGHDGFLYFAQGTATNSGIVGVDNFDFGWLKQYPLFHDTPGQDITLAGENFVSANPLTPELDDSATTGAFLPFGTPSKPGQVIPGEIPCTGAVMRVPLGGGPLELVAWGFRNPFGLAFAPGGSLYATENGFDERGSRPVFGGADYLWRIEKGLWYGWPDFAGGMPLTADYFGEASNKQPKFLLAQHPNEPPQPVGRLGVHSSSNGVSFSHAADFGYAGEAFIAQFGDMAPNVGKVTHPVGFRVVRVNVETGEVNDFATNEGSYNAPASKLNSGGLERPVDVKFSKDGLSLYIVDFGVMMVKKDGPEPVQNTGILWRVTRRR